MRPGNVLLVLGRGTYVVLETLRDGTWLVVGAIRSLRDWLHYMVGTPWRRDGVWVVIGGNNPVLANTGFRVMVNQTTRVYLVVDLVTNDYWVLHEGPSQATLYVSAILQEYRQLLRERERLAICDDQMDGDWVLV